VDPPFPPPDLETNNGVYSYEISQTTSSTEPLKRPGRELLSMRGSRLKSGSGTSAPSSDVASESAMRAKANISARLVVASIG
jgi:hypothetical protein